MSYFQLIGLIYEIFFKKSIDIGSIEKKGLLAVKLGQMFALRIDFLSPEKCVALTKLYENTEIKKGAKLHELTYLNGEWFDEDTISIEERPFASASVAQVHKCMISDDEYAMKILKDDYIERFKKDVEKAIKLFRLAIVFYPKLKRVANPVALLEMIRTDTLNELDLTYEIKHQKILKGIYNDYNSKVNLSRLKFPLINEDMSNSNVLVSEMIKGESFQQLLSKGELKYNDLLDLFHIHGFYIFCIGIFHGDIHPGNIILSGDGIYFIDTGAIGYVSKYLREGLYNFMKSLSYYDFRSCAKHLHSMSDVRLDKEKYTRYEGEFLKLYSDFENTTVKEVSLTRKMMETIKLGVNHGMVFSKGIFPIIKSLMYLDGMVLKCNPDAVLMKDMRNFIGELDDFLYREVVNE